MCNTTKKNYSVPATSTTTCLTPSNTTLAIKSVKLHKTKQLPSAGKEYLCFHINKKASRAAKYVKSRILNKDIDSILYIDTFEQQFFVIKCMLQSIRLEYNMKNIGIDQ